MEEKLQDIKVSGAGSICGGKYRDVKISGAGNVNGDIECILFKTSGASTVNGNLKSKSLSVNGATKIKGRLEAEDINISGGSEIKGDIVTKIITVSGTSKIGGSLGAQEVNISGSVEIKEDCEAECFKASGGFEIGGLLNAGEVDIFIHGKCRVREIGGEKINIRMGNSNMFSKMLKHIFIQGEKLTTSVIEGDDIYLEGTNAKIVRGNNVTIGPDCNIEIIEYRNIISVASDAKVKEQRKI